MTDYKTLTDEEFAALITDLRSDLEKHMNLVFGEDGWQEIEDEYEKRR